MKAILFVCVSLITTVLLLTAAYYPQKWRYVLVLRVLAWAGIGTQVYFMQQHTGWVAAILSCVAGSAIWYFLLPSSVAPEDLAARPTASHGGVRQPSTMTPQVAQDKLMAHANALHENVQTNAAKLRQLRATRKRSF